MVKIIEKREGHVWRSRMENTNTISGIIFTLLYVCILQVKESVTGPITKQTVVIYSHRGRANSDLRLVTQYSAVAIQNFINDILPKSTI